MMTYSNKFVMCVLINGRPQKELANGQVSLPFGTEYSLRFRNKNDRRAVVEIWIDGENISGGGYVIDANSYVDIQRHHDIDRSFKFVSLDSEDAVDHGKNGPNKDKVKGVIEAKFQLEVERPKEVHHDHHHHHHHDHYKPVPYPTPYPIPYPRPPIWFNNETERGAPTYKGKPDGKVYPSGLGGGVARGMNVSNDTSMSDGTLSFNDEAAPKATLCSAGNDIAQFKRISSPPPEKELLDGCTVEGSSTGQRFRQVNVDLESAVTSLKLFLVGYEEDEVEVVQSKKKNTVKDNKVSKLEEENQRLKQELADLKEKEIEEENQKLKNEIEKEKKKKAANKRVTKKRTRRSKKSTGQ